MMYDHFVGVYIPCVEAEGYSVDDVPSREQYLAAPDGQKWFPRQFVDQGVVADIAASKYSSMEEFDALCPHTPSLEVLYGDR